MSRIGHSGSSVIKVYRYYYPTGLFRGSGGQQGRRPDRKSFQARRLSALRSSLGRAARISCGDGAASLLVRGSRRGGLPRG
jgi:hypothetical protein